MAIATGILIAASVAAAAVAVQFAINALVELPSTDTGSVDAGSLISRRRSDRELATVLVGERFLGGFALYDNSYGGERNEFFTWTTGISVRPCHEFLGLYLNGTLAELSGDPTEGEVEILNPEFRGKPDGEAAPARAWLRVFLGHDNSEIGAYLAGKFGDDFTSVDRGCQMCIVVLTIQNTNDDLGDGSDPEDQQGKSYIPFTSPPEQVWHFRGALICDPRIEGASYEDYSSYVYSNNALLLDAQIDYGFVDGAEGLERVVVGRGYDAGLLDIEHIKAAADHADKKGYKANGIIRSNNTADQDEVQKAMNGVRIEAPGFVKTIPASFHKFWRTIDFEGLADAYVEDYNEEGASTEVLNELHGTYVEPADKFTNRSLPIYTRPEWIASDNHIPRVGKVEYKMVTDGAQALLLLKQRALMSRAPAKVRLANLPLRFLATPVGGLVDLVNTEVPAVNGRRWLVTGMGRNEDELITLSLSEWMGEEALELDASDPALDDTVYSPTRDLHQPNGTEVLSESLISTIRAVNNVFGVSISPSMAIGGAQSNVITALVTSPSLTAFSYEWTWESGGANITINSPDEASTSFAHTGTGEASGVALCTVTGAGQQASIAALVSLSVP